MSNPVMDRDAREVTAHIHRGAEDLDRRAAEESAPDRRAFKTEAAGGARAYAQYLQTATVVGTLTQTDIDAGRLVAHAAHMGGWLSETGIVTSERRGLRQLVRTGTFEHKPVGGETRPRYVLVNPQCSHASRTEAATTREVDQARRLAQGQPITSPTAAAAVTATSTPTTGRSVTRDHSAQIG